MNFKNKLVSFVLISATVIASSATLAMANTLGCVNTNNVNVRTQSNVNSEVLTKYGTGQALNIIGYENDFFKVDIDGADLYIAADFVDVLKAQGVICGDNVNVRVNASMESNVLGTLNDGDTVVVVGCNDGWLKIEYNDSVGYINEDFVQGDFVKYISGNMEPAEVKSTEVEQAAVEQTEIAPKAMASDELYAVVTSSTGLRLRSSADLESNVITLISSGVAVDVLAQESGWVKVNYAGNEGYVSDEFVEIKYGVKPVFNSSKAQQVIDYGKQFLGTPYKWAGNDLTKGVDCSGFVYNVYKHFGVSLNRSSAAMTGNGHVVSKSDLQPGDLVLFDTSGPNNGGISHVGIYMGDDKFIHSSSSTRTWGVVISSLNEDYYIRTYVTARRVL